MKCLKLPYLTLHTNTLSLIYCRSVVGTWRHDAFVALARVAVVVFDDDAHDRPGGRGHPFAPRPPVRPRHRQLLPSHHRQWSPQILRLSHPRRTLQMGREVSHSFNVVCVSFRGGIHAILSENTVEFAVKKVRRFYYYCYLPLCS